MNTNSVPVPIVEPIFPNAIPLNSEHSTSSVDNMAARVNQSNDIIMSYLSSRDQNTFMFSTRIVEQYGNITKYGPPDTREGNLIKKGRKKQLDEAVEFINGFKTCTDARVAHYASACFPQEYIDEVLLRESPNARLFNIKIEMIKMRAVDFFYLINRVVPIPATKPKIFRNLDNMVSITKIFIPFLQMPRDPRVLASMDTQGPLEESIDTLWESNEEDLAIRLIEKLISPFRKVQLQLKCIREYTQRGDLSGALALYNQINKVFNQMNQHDQYVIGYTKEEACEIILGCAIENNNRDITQQFLDSYTNPGKRDATLNKLVKTYIKKGNNATALAIANHISDPTRKQNALLEILEALLSQDRIEAALQFVGERMEGRFISAALEKIATYYISKGKPNEAEALVPRLHENQRNNTLLSITVRYISQNRFQDAERVADTIQNDDLKKDAYSKLLKGLVNISTVPFDRSVVLERIAIKFGNLASAQEKQKAFAMIAHYHIAHENRAAAQSLVNLLEDNQSNEIWGQVVKLFKGTNTEKAFETICLFKVDTDVRQREQLNCLEEVMDYLSPQTLTIEGNLEGLSAQVERSLTREHEGIIWTARKSIIQTYYARNQMEKAYVIVVNLPEHAEKAVCFQMIRPKLLAYGKTLVGQGNIEKAMQVASHLEDTQRDELLIVIRVYQAKIEAEAAQKLQADAVVEPPPAPQPSPQPPQSPRPTQSSQPTVEPQPPVDSTPHAPSPVPPNVEPDRPVITPTPDPAPTISTPIVPPPPPPPHVPEQPVTPPVVPVVVPEPTPIKNEKTEPVISKVETPSPNRPVKKQSGIKGLIVRITGFVGTLFQKIATGLKKIPSAVKYAFQAYIYPRKARQSSSVR